VEVGQLSELYQLELAENPMNDIAEKKKAAVPIRNGILQEYLEVTISIKMGNRWKTKRVS
jgi:hypothetical protein